MTSSTHIRVLSLALLGLCLAFPGIPALAQDLPERIVNRWGMEFILVPAGRYQVCLGQESDEVGTGFADLEAFYLQVTEVTQSQWQALKVDTRFGKSTQAENLLPAHGLSHGDALNLVSAINRAAGKRLYRLPREAEWEAACRAGGGDTPRTPDRLAPDQLTKTAWTRADSRGRPHKVAGKSPNNFGFHDMLGNLYEWVQESYDPRACPGPLEGDPQGPTRGLYRILRGGSYNSTPATARCGWRFFYEPTARHPENGCRLVRAAVPLTDGER